MTLEDVKRSSEALKENGGDQELVQKNRKKRNYLIKYRKNYKNRKNKNSFENKKKA